MHPLDLLKVKFQVASSRQTRAEAGGDNIGKQIWTNLQRIVRNDGWAGLYRGLTPNMVGNASSWGFYFLW